MKKLAMKKYLVLVLSAFVLIFSSRVFYKHYFSANINSEQAPSREIRESDPHMDKIPEALQSGEIEEPQDQQSPIAIDTSDTTKVVDLNLRDIIFRYKSKRFEVKHGEHAIETFPLSAKTLTGHENKLIDYIILDEMGYRLVKFHLHMPSEHTINGKRYPLEIHFVHTREKLDEKGNILRDQDGKELFDYAVIGVLVDKGAAHPEFEKIITRMPHDKEHGANIIEEDIDLLKIIPANRRVLRYYGSLTTKPFTTGVKWQLIKEPIEFSQDQLDRIAQAMNHRKNARKIQHLRVPVVNDVASDSL